MMHQGHCSTLSWVLKSTKLSGDCCQANQHDKPSFLIVADTVPACEDPETF